MVKTKLIYDKLFRDSACQKLFKSDDVSVSYSKNKSGTVFWDMVYFIHLQAGQERNWEKQTKQKLFLNGVRFKAEPLLSSRLSVCLSSVSTFSRSEVTGVLIFTSNSKGSREKPQTTVNALLIFLLCSPTPKSIYV